MSGSQQKKQYKRAMEALKPIDDKKTGKQPQIQMEIPDVPPSPFVIFLQDYKKRVPEPKPFPSLVRRDAFNVWKSMSAADKSTYVTKAADERVKYETLQAAYDKEKQQHDGERKRMCIGICGPPSPCE